MASQFIITVDVGTSSTKTSLWTETGQLVAHASATYDLHRPEPLWAEIDGDIWWRAVCETIQTVLAKSEVVPADIAGIGVDGVSWKEYGDKLEENLKDLVKRLKAKQYRPQPARRVYIPKDNKTMRPLGIPAQEDKVVQLGVGRILGNN